MKKLIFSEKKIESEVATRKLGRLTNSIFFFIHCFVVSATTRLHAALQKAAADELGEPVVVVGPKPSP